MRAFLATLTATALPFVACSSAPPAEPVSVAAPPVAPVVAAVPEAPPARRAPAFTMASADDSTAAVTLDTFAGEAVLVDFWATWCEPCVAEIPTIAAVHDEFGARGFRVVSVSMDFSREDLARGRAARPMPWTHVYLDESFDDPAAVAFGVDRLPFAVLIGPDGTIAAEGGAVRGANLRTAVARALRL